MPGTFNAPGVCAVTGVNGVVGMITDVCLMLLANPLLYGALPSCSGDGRLPVSMLGPAKGSFLFVSTGEITVVASANRVTLGDRALRPACWNGEPLFASRSSWMVTERLLFFSDDMMATMAPKCTDNLHSTKESRFESADVLSEDRLLLGRRKTAV